MNPTQAYQEKVLKLAAEGKISPEDGQALLAALPRSRVRIFRALWDPFGTLAQGPLLALGALGLAAWIATARFGCRFDGALDLHVGPHALAWRVVLVDLGVAWLLTAGLLWLACLPWTPRTRLRDLLVLPLVAKLPLLAAAVPSALVLRPVGPDLLQDLPRLVAVGLATLPFLAWSLLWMVMGLRAASGLRGARLALCAVLGLLGAEILTKACLFFLR